MTEDDLLLTPYGNGRKKKAGNFWGRFLGEFQGGVASAPIGRRRSSVAVKQPSGEAVGMDEQRVSGSPKQSPGGLQHAQVGNEEEMRKFLLNAQAQGRTLERRVQIPVLGLALLGICAVMTVNTALRRTPLIETVSSLISVTSAVLLLFSAQASHRARVYNMSAIAVCFGALIMALVLNNLRATIGIFRECVGITDACCGLARFARDGDFFHGHAPCWYLWYHLRWRLVCRGFAGGLACVLVSACLMKRLPSREQLLANWMSIGTALAILTIGECVTAAAIAALGLVGANKAVFAYTLILALVNGLLTAFALRSDTRRAVHGWLASRGESVSTAVGIASLIGSRGVDDVQQQALSTLRGIRLDLLTRADLESNAPSAEIFARSAPARFGEIDAFISHSWHDDPTVKWKMLQMWRSDFKMASPNRREPVVWFDRACINPEANDLDTQLALLPVWCASCQSFVILFTPTWLRRLWCIVELFVWLHVGGTQALVVLCSINWLCDRAAAATHAARNTIEEGEPQCVSQSVAQIAAEPRDPTEQAQHASLRSAAAASLETFDVRKAECVGRDTRALLLSVIEIGCGSLEAFEAIARSVLAARLHVQAAQQDALRSSQQRTPQPAARLLAGATMRFLSPQAAARVYPAADRASRATRQRPDSGAVDGNQSGEDAAGSPSNRATGSCIQAATRWSAGPALVTASSASTPWQLRTGCAGQQRASLPSSAGRSSASTGPDHRVHWMFAHVKPLTKHPPKQPPHAALNRRP